MADSRIDKWCRWAEVRIRNEVLTMHLHRYAFQEVGRITKANDNLPPTYFWEYLQDTYATTQAVAIRRQAETGPRVCTLGRLITEIGNDAPRLSRSWWVGMWDWDDDRVAHSEFTEHFAGKVGDHLDPAIPAEDLERLDQAASIVKVYVDERVAHSDAKAQEELPTFDNLDSAIDLIGELFRKYVSLLTAKSYAKLVPAIPHDWLRGGPGWRRGTGACWKQRAAVNGTRLPPTKARTWLS